MTIPEIIFFGLQGFLVVLTIGMAVVIPVDIKRSQKRIDRVREIERLYDENSKRTRCCMQALLVAIDTIHEMKCARCNIALMQSLLPYSKEIEIIGHEFNIPSEK